ncbi:MAG: tail fiber protein [Mucilaginibacter sp.]|uniref:phage tail protein n=1 Tax=Mucilaginibacter sp. TaxID=1882438 RepID=UPI0032679EE9
MDSPYVGQIQTFAFNFAPRGWMLCAGQTLSISQYSALFSLLGTNYGGNGQTTFQLPDLQGRVAVGFGNGLGLSPYVIGQKAGTENVSILTSNMPSHTHVATFTPSGGGGGAVTATLNVVNAAGTAITAGATGTSYLAGAHGLGTAAGIYATTGTLTALNAGSITVTGGGASSGGTVTNAVTGNGLPIPILQPYLAINYSIALQGIFPSRN